MHSTLRKRIALDMDKSGRHAHPWLERCNEDFGTRITKDLHGKRFTILSARLVRSRRAAF
jgi:hypothetical protein